MEVSQIDACGLFTAVTFKIIAVLAVLLVRKRQKGDYFSLILACAALWMYAIIYYFISFLCDTNSEFILSLVNIAYFTLFCTLYLFEDLFPRWSDIKVRNTNSKPLKRD